MKIENVSISEIKPYDRNAKKHDEKQIKNVMESIKQFGFAQPVVIDKNNVLIIGHCRYEASKRLTLKEIPTVRMDELSQEQVDKLRLLDNKLNESEWDMDLLIDDIPELDFDGFDIDWGLPDILEDTEITEVDVPDVPEEPTVKRGEVWQLGTHRLMCGDATDINDIVKLVGGDKIDLYITDPPYNVDYTGKTKDSLKIKNDKQDDDSFRQFLVSAFNSAKSVMKAGASYYIWHADSEGYNFRGACKDIGWQVRECLIWSKNSMVLGRQDYQWQHEPCLYGWNEGSHAWYSDRKQTTILKFDRPSRSEEHPTMKPIALFDYLIKNSSKQGDNILDNFAGSGTTIMACEQNNRNAYCMELDPKYCDVIIKRWENYTGNKAVLLNI